MSWDNIKIDFGEINGWKFITIILTVLIGIFMWTGYGLKNQLEQQVIAINNYQKDSVTFTVKVNKLGQELSIQKSVVTIKTKEIQQILLEKSELVELNHQIKIKSSTQLANITAKWESNNKANYDESLDYEIDQPLPYEDFIIDTTGIEYIALGTSFIDSTKWYNISGTILKSGLNIKHLSIINDDEYNIGYGKRKIFKEFFKPKPLVLEVIHNNPHTSTIALKNIQLDPLPKKWFQTTAAKVGAGIIVGSVAVMYLN